MKSSKSAKESQFGPLQKKTFSSALNRFFEQQCPQLGGHLTREVIVNNVQRLVEEFYPPHSHLRMGQVMWPAVDENETAAYGKSIEKTKLKPVFVDMIAAEDIEAMLKGEKAKLIRQRTAVRLFKQAKEQVRKKREFPALSKMRFEVFKEGKSAQILYIGPYCDEGLTIKEIKDFITNQDNEPRGKHHEIYLSDPRKTSPEELKTIIRQPFE